MKAQEKTKGIWFKAKTQFLEVDVTEVAMFAREKNKRVNKYLLCSIYMSKYSFLMSVKLYCPVKILSNYDVSSF